MALLLNEKDIGISGKIADIEERARLKDLAARSKPDDMGIIFRTQAEGASEEELSEEIRQLIGKWRSLQPKIPRVSVPGLVYRDLNLIDRLIRDRISRDVEMITVDSEETARILREALKEIGRDQAEKVRLLLREDIFDHYGVDEEIQKNLQTKVWLKSGSCLVVQQTEALAVIDVNTGKYVGMRSLDETVLQTNLEAATEIARQLRLRNIGGIIIIDFIDMSAPEDRQQVLDTLEKCCMSDKMACQILGFTKLGLVEMTRKKVGQTLAERYSKT